MTNMVLDTSYVSVLTFQDIHYFSKYVRSLYASFNSMESEIEIYFFDEKERRINIDKTSELIINPLLIDFASKKIQTSLVNYLKTELALVPELKNEVDQEFEKLQKLITSILDIVELPFQIDDFWDAAKIVKAFTISIDGSKDGETQFALLCRYIDVVSKLRTFNGLFLVGLNEILTQEELLEFYQYSLSKQVPLFCVEHSSSRPVSNSFARYLFLDNEYEEIDILPLKTKLFIDSDID